jgi:uncharacterized SAM-binding protein YcdF (DUF218 family)
MKFLQFLKWLVPVVLSVCGAFLISAGHRYSFLGFLLCCIALVVVIYYLIAMLQRQHFMPAKILRTVVSSLLCMGLLVMGVTEVLILHAGNQTPADGCQYIIVLGARVHGTGPSSILTERIDAAERYLNDNPETIAVLSGGQGDDELISEAQCMYNELTARGISPDRLWLESTSTSSMENLRFSLALLEEKTGAKPASIGIVTSEFHIYRTTCIAEGLGVRPVPIPAATGRFVFRLNYTLREFAGVWKYWILGG